MSDIQTLDSAYWSNRYKDKQTGWDIGTISPPLKSYFNQLTDLKAKILIPGAGNAYEAEYLHKNGFENVFLIDIAKDPLDNFKKRCPTFPTTNILFGDFFELNMKFDLIIEQTFFCALNPNLRSDYAAKMFELLKETGKLVGLLFDDPLFTDHPPFGGNKTEYLTYFEPIFSKVSIEKCYNSLPPRANRELFIIIAR